MEGGEEGTDDIWAARHDWDNIAFQLSGRHTGRTGLGLANLVSFLVGNFLLATPFRYPPLPHGSRFGTRAERGIWYGAESVRTMFAEVAYYRLLFIHGTEADLGVLELSLTAFRASVATDFGVDLTAGAFVPYRETIASRTAYAATQVLGGEMRAAGVRAFRYPSARDPAGGFCVGLFDPSAFKDKRPIRSETWYCFASRSGVELKRAGYSQRATYVFPLGVFRVDGALPQPAF